MAARGVKQLELGKNAIITDFARETAELCGIELVQPGTQTQPPRVTTPPAPQNVSQGRFNKPRGCQHGPLNNSAMLSNTAAQPAQSQETSSVNALVDIVGKIMKQGG